MPSAIIIANGQWLEGAAVHTVLSHQDESFIICADGGANHAFKQGIRPDILIGDLDSVDDQVLQTYRQDQISILQYPPVKNETDLQLCLLFAAEKNFDSICILAGFGDEIDHQLANILLLSDPAFVDMNIYFAHGDQLLYLWRQGQHTLSGQPGERVSLIPIGADAVAVTTTGLLYPLVNENLIFGPARGMSNEMTGSEAQITFTQGLLVAVHTLKERA
ncbi:thiamine diphosphokinase [Anaerolineales bacterium]